MDSSKNLLELVLSVLEVLRAIEINSEYDPDKDGSSIVGEQYFFNAFNMDVAKKRDADLILSLAAEAPYMIHNETLNKDALRLRELARFDA